MKAAEQGVWCLLAIRFAGGASFRRGDHDILIHALIRVIVLRILQ
jgi:hypothetical protein